MNRTYTSFILLTITLCIASIIRAQDASEPSESHSSKRESEQSDTNVPLGTQLIERRELSSLTVRRVDYPGQADQLANKEWLSKPIRRHESKEEKCQLLVTLPDGTKVISSSSSIRFIVDQNGISLMRIFPVFDAGDNLEIVQKMINHIEHWNLKLTAGSSQTMKRIRKWIKQDVDLKEKFIGHTSITGRIPGEPHVNVEFQLNESSYSLCFYADRELSRQIRGVKQTKYRVKFTNVTSKSDSKYLSEHYRATVWVKNENGNVIYSDEPEVAPDGTLHHYWGSTLHIPIPEVPDNGALQIRIKPNPHRDNPEKTLKYDSFETRIPGHELTIDETIRLKIQKNPEFNDMSETKR